MKKTSIVIFILVISFICLMAGCRKQIQPAEANNSVLEEIAVPYDFSLFFTYPDGSYRPCNMMRQLWYYPNVTPCYVSEDLMYAVFKGNDDTIGDYYGYVFFQYYKPHPNSTESDESSRWFVVGRLLRISKRLSQNDFSDITIGSSISDVEKVNPVTSLAIPLYDKVGSKDYSLSFDTFHYTDDGILRITFARETIDDEYTVSDIELNSSFEVDPYVGSSIEGKNPPIKLKINPEHIPN